MAVVPYDPMNHKPAFHLDNGLAQTGNKALSDTIIV